MRRILLVVLLISIFPLSARAQQSSFAVVLEDLVPGVPQTEVGTVQLERDALLRGLEWVERTGILEDANIQVEVCVPGDWCVDANNPDNSVFPAGTLDVFVTATLSADAESGGSGTAVGQLVFFADDEEGDPDLPLTGFELASMTAWAVALISIGALVIVIGRRHDPHRESER